MKCLFCERLGATERLAGWPHAEARVCYNQVRCRARVIAAVEAVTGPIPEEVTR